MPKKKAVKDEIDLIENIIVVWDKKWYVLLRNLDLEKA